VTPAQREALERLMTGPTGLRSATARALHRSGLIEPDGDYWKITAAGRRQVEYYRWWSAHRAVADRLTAENRDWGERVWHWLTATLEAGADVVRVMGHVRHVAACEHAGIDPGPLDPGLHPDWGGWIAGTVRRASECLRHLDTESQLATERGVGITVDFQADPPVPRARRDAAAAAARPDGAVDLRTYRARRPEPA